MTATSEQTDADRPPALYPRLLGPAWLDLHPAIRWLHLTDGVATGRFEFHHGRGLAARLTCWALRLPSSAMMLEGRLAIARDAESERWARTFGRRLLVTIQRGLPDGTLAERFGALEFRFHLRVVEGALARPRRPRSSGIDVFPESHQPLLLGGWCARLLRYTRVRIQP
jgi:Domain of unknown function (DUF4166)